MQNRAKSAYITDKYDTANRRSIITDARGNTAAYSYDENSNVAAITEIDYSDLGEPNETFVTTYQYDNLDRLILVVDNNTTQYGYDSRSDLTRVTDALNNETRYEYDGLSRSTSTTYDMNGDVDGQDFLKWHTWDDSSMPQSPP